MIDPPPLHKGGKPHPFAPVAHREVIPEDGGSIFFPDE